MIKLEGTVINTFRVDGGTNKKGEEYEARQGAIAWFVGTSKRTS